MFPCLFSAAWISAALKVVAALFMIVHVTLDRCALSVRVYLQPSGLSACLPVQATSFPGHSRSYPASGVHGEVVQAVELLSSVHVLAGSLLWGRTSLCIPSYVVDGCRHL